MLDIKTVSKNFGGLPALDQVSFVVPKGQITALIGPNGAGKSTMINCLTGLLNIDSGQVLFENQDITHWPAHCLAHSGLQRTFQNLRLFPRLSVLDNVLTGLISQASQSIVQAMLRSPSLRHQERHLKLRALEALDQLGLTDKALWPVQILAYGDKKRVELARAMVSQPKVLLLDEPVAGLNDQETHGVTELLQSLRRNGQTILVVEHDMTLVMTLADQIVVLDSGTCIATGQAQEIQNNPLVLEAYLGQMEATA